MYPGKSKYMVESYRDATSTPFSYLLVDLKPDTEEKLIDVQHLPRGADARLPS